MPRISALGGMSSRGFGEFAQSSTTAKYIEDYFSTYLYTGNGTYQAINNQIDLGNESNATAYTTPGTYYWRCPAGVTSVSVVCVGGGGGSNTNPNGGGGGGLGYKNNITVVPGTLYTVVVGAGGTPTTIVGGDSYFISAATVKGGGANGVTGGTYTGDGGGNGGTSQAFHAGSGAGGYSGSGGNGATGYGSGSAGSGGGGGGGGEGIAGGYAQFAAGGGVGIYGQGSNGAGGTGGTSVTAGGGGGGSGGTNGGNAIGTSTRPNGGVYGGGAGCSITPTPTYYPGTGGSGAVRIVWPGTTRQFPSTNVSFTADTSNAGLVWAKSRSNTQINVLVDTVRGAGNYIQSQSTTTNTGRAGIIGGFSSSGFSVDASVDASTNTNAYTYTSWTWRKAPKFFDIITYTGTGTNTTISHNLGSVPGMILIKRTDANAAWAVYHRSLANTEYMVLNTTAAKATGATYWNSTTPTATVFSLGTSTDVNASGGTYVAYLFAHDAGGFGVDGTQNVISCGQFTTSSGAVNLGWEPQWIMYKDVNSVSDWIIVDNMRGDFIYDGANTNGQAIYPNTTGGEASWYIPYPNATGFTPIVAGTFIYMAIRRGPMKVPTDATTVFKPTIYTGNATAGTVISAGFPVDQVFSLNRNRSSTTLNPVFDRLRGGTQQLSTNNTNVESTLTAGTSGTSFDNQTGWVVNTGSATNGNLGLFVAQMFRRAPSFMDVVCYTGTGSATTVSHNLGAVPELMIVKSRSAITNWIVYNTQITNTSYLILNATDAVASSGAVWNNTTPTSSVFTVGTSLSVAARTYVAYLFSSCPGVSKVGSYTGTGATQTISCGFTGGARYVLIKRTDSTGDWWVWDTARGMVAGTDPRLPYNSTSSETNANWVYTTTGGFQIVTSDATVNASGGTYIYLAIA